MSLAPLISAQPCPEHEGYLKWKSQALSLLTFSFKPGCNCIICQLSVVSDDSLIDIRVFYITRIVDYHLDDYSRTVFLIIKRGQIRREVLRQHGECLTGSVNGCCIMMGMLVDRRILFYQGIYVCHSHKNLYVIVLHYFRHSELVKVPGIIIINRYP